MSIITFNFTDDPATSLGGEGYSCGMPIPADGTVNGYTGLHASSCSYCADLCEAPAVNHDIGFWDGFNFHIVGWSYFGIICFTIVFQVVSCLICRRKPPVRVASQLVNENANQSNRNSAQ